MYYERCSVAMDGLKNKKDMTVLGIESSCDETAAAVVRGGRTVLSNVISSQIAVHQKYKGVVPEIASRCHTQCIASVAQQAVDDAGLSFSEIDAIAVTAGPGLIGGLLVGVSYAKALALALDKPFIGVHHIEGHISADYITHSDLQPPFIALVVSGGHSHIFLCEDYCKYKLLGCTRDDAAGEAFDKVARVLGLPYPGGVQIDAIAPQGNPKAFAFHTSLEHEDTLDFSFSGVKTSVINLVHGFEQKGEAIPVADIAASFQAFVCKSLVSKAVRAAQDIKIDKIALAGGVSANSQLRALLTSKALQKGIKVYCPELILCTDNAAMIASAGYYRLRRGEFSDLSLNALANMSIL